MLKNLANFIWRKSPLFLRRRLVRSVQSKFTTSVGAVIFNEENKVLLLDHVFRPASGWGIPGGFMEHNEQPEAALRRELREEADLELRNLRLLSVRTIGKHIEIIFRADAAGEARANNFEINAAGWFRPDEMPAEMSRSQKKLIKKVLDSE